MTTLNQARAAVYNRFMDEWPISSDDDLSLWRMIQLNLFGDSLFTAFVTGDLRSPYCFGNEVMDNEEVWARCFVISLPNSQETLGRPGNRKFKRRAQVQVNIYTPPGEGMSRADAMVKAAMDMFEGRTLLGAAVKFYEASSAEVGLVEESRWFLSTVTAYFDYEEIK